MKSLNRYKSALIVDDCSDSVIPLSILLEGLGWETEIAFDGVEALRKARYFEPNLVLLDINMPKLDGLGTCMAIKAQPWSKNTRIFAITGLDTQEIHDRAKIAGFDAVLIKPIDYSKLSDLLAYNTANSEDNL